MTKKKNQSLSALRGEDLSTSQLLFKLKDMVAGGGDMTVDQMLRLFGVRGFGFLLFVLSLLNIAIFFLPGISFIFGLPMVVFAVQMLLGIQRPVLPSFLRHRTIQRAALVRGLDLGMRVTQKVEPLIRPRWPVLVDGPLAKVHHGLALFLAFLVAIPVPFFNLPPSFGLVALALGVMQRDGLFITLSYALGIWSFFLYESLGDFAKAMV